MTEIKEIHYNNLSFEYHEQILDLISYLDIDNITAKKILQNEQSTCYVILQNDKIVAFACMNLFTLRFIRVHKDYRNQGLSSLLISFINTSVNHNYMLYTSNEIILYLYRQHDIINNITSSLTGNKVSKIIYRKNGK